MYYLLENINHYLGTFDMSLYTHAIDIYFDFLQMLIFILTEPI